MLSLLRGGAIATIALSTGALVVLGPACAEPLPETHLQVADLVKPEGGEPFDKTALVTVGAFRAMGRTSQLAAIQAFLERTPYGGRGSFLAVYQSNGLSAADALFRAGQAHHINPLVLLVRAQMDEGLVGLQYYPLPASRVEHVFRCGCVSGNVCDPAYAGFDRQVNCLAARLEQSMEEMACPGGATAGGWGVGKEQRTLDGITVTPGDEATAALYQYEPVVGVGKRGAWLFWNIWNLYTTKLYPDPIKEEAVRGIGAPCCAETQCTYERPICDTSWPGGICTRECESSTDCPALEGAESFCAWFGDKNYCLAACNEGVSGSCRTGYECVSVNQPGNKGPAGKACVKSAH
jgi:hypothetical protein